MLFGFLEETHLVDEQTVQQVAYELKTELGDVVASGPQGSSAGKGAATDGDELNQRLSKIEQKLDRNDQAIKRALALIAASLDKESK
jgi:hypothetical protein